MLLHADVGAESTAETVATVAGDDAAATPGPHFAGQCLMDRKLLQASLEPKLQGAS